MEPVKINANITPIPAFKEGGKWMVYIHISFVKINDDKSISKVMFNEYPLIKQFIAELKPASFTLQASGSSKTAKFPVTKPSQAYWNLFDKYKLEDKLNQVRDYHSDRSLAKTVIDVNAEIKRLNDLITATTNKIGTTKNLLTINNKNFEIYDGILQDLSQSFTNFKKDLDRITASGSTNKKELNKYTERIQKYQTNKTDLGALITKETRSIKDDTDQCAAWQAEIDELTKARDIFVHFKDKTFVSGNQEDAVKIIADYLKNDKKTPESSGSTKYTSDVSHPVTLTLTDILAYFTAYPAFLENLGLLIKVPLEDDLSAENGTLSIAYPDPKIGDITLTLHKTWYEIDKPTGYFFPLPNDATATKYKKGYLDLTLQTNGVPSYALLQNNFEEIINNQPNSSDEDDGKDSSHTRGFFLTQNNPKKDLNFSHPEGDLFLEDLLVGYRIDVKRNERPWNSLNQRVYRFNFPSSQPDHVTDEGFISSNSATKGYELVLYEKAKEHPHDPTELDEINLYKAIDKTDPYKILVAAENYISLTLTFTKGAAALVAYDPDKMILTIRADHGLTVEQFVAQLNTFLGDEANKVVLVTRLIQVDNTGRLYYSGFKTGAIKDLPSYIPSSVICHITGHNLNAPRRMGKKLRDTFNGLISTSTLGIEDFMNQSAIELDIDVLDWSMPRLRIGDNYKVRCRLALIGGIGLPVTDAAERCILSNPYLRLDPIHAPTLAFGSEYNKSGNHHAYQEIGDAEQQIIIRDSIIADLQYPTESKRYIIPPSIPWSLAESMKMMDDKDQPVAQIMLNTKQFKRPQYIKVGMQGKTPIYKWVYNTGKFGKYITEKDKKSTPYIVDGMADSFLIEPTAIYSADRFENTQQAKLLVKQDLSKPDVIASNVRLAAQKRLSDLKDLFKGIFIQHGEPVCSFWKNASRQSTDSGIVWTLIVTGLEKDALHSSNTTARIEQSTHTIRLYIQKGEDIEFTIRCCSSKSKITTVKYGDELVKNADYPWSIAKTKNTLFSERRFRTIHALMKPWNPHLDDIKRNELFIQQQFEPSRSTDFPLEVIIEQGIHFVGRTASEIYLIAEWDEIFDDIPEKDILQRSSPTRIKRNHKKVFAYNSPGFFGSKQGEAYVFLPAKTISPFFIPEKEKKPEKKINADKTPEKRIYADIEGRGLIFRHDLGSARFHSIRYSMIAESRFKSYYAEGDHDKFNSEVTQHFETNKIPDFKLNATQSPLKPEVAYIVPLFHNSDDKSIHFYKTFKGLRVYLKRPWYSSGYGEMLAVILKGPPADTQIKDDWDWVSQIGRDITTSNDNLIALRVGGADNTTKSRKLLEQYTMPIKEGSSITVTPALFPVYFNMENLLWYADIFFPDVIYDTYYCPFVKLVIARFQPFSQPGVELSAPCVCDFMQIYPDRTITNDKSRPALVVKATAIKKDAAGNPLTEMRFWPITHKVSDSSIGYMFTEDDLRSGFSSIDYDNEKKTFTYPYDGKCTAIIVREYEWFENTDKQKNSVDNTHRRLLYTHVITLNPTP